MQLVKFHLRSGVSRLAFELPSPSATSSTAATEVTAATRSSVTAAASTSHTPRSTATTTSSASLVVNEIPWSAFLVHSVVPLFPGSILRPPGVHHTLTLESLVVALVLFVLKYLNSEAF